MLGLRLWLCRMEAVSIIKCSDGALPPFFSEKNGADLGDHVGSTQGHDKATRLHPKIRNTLHFETVTKQQQYDIRLI